MTRTSHSSSGIAQPVIRRPRAGDRADSQFFTNWETLEAAEWDAAKVSGLLQTRPSPYYGLMPFVQEFHLVKAMNIATTVAKANPQYGEGGERSYLSPIKSTPPVSFRSVT